MEALVEKLCNRFSGVSGMDCLTIGYHSISKFCYSWIQMLSY